MYRSSPFRSTSRTNCNYDSNTNMVSRDRRNTFATVCMNQPCTRSAKTLTKCRKTWGYNKFMVRKNGHENAPWQVDGAKNKVGGWLPCDVEDSRLLKRSSFRIGQIHENPWLFLYLPQYHGGGSWISSHISPPYHHSFHLLGCPRKLVNW